MIISDINYIETADLEVQGGFLPYSPFPPSAAAYSNAGGTAFGRAWAQTLTYTFTNAISDIGAKSASSSALSTSVGEV
jgi:hypothetical protein